MPEDSKPSLYTEEDIMVYEGLQHVRMRPGMYIGGKDLRALHQLIHEVVKYTVEETFAGDCDQLSIILHSDNSITIQNNGVGISIKTDETTKRPLLEAVMTKMGARYSEKKGYYVPRGLMGVGMAAVNGLSDNLIIESRHKGELYRQSFKAGHPTSSAESIRDLEPDELTGTKITFLPDSTIMEATIFDYPTLILRCRELAFLVPSLHIILRNEREQPTQETVFRYENGLVEFVRHLNNDEKPLHDIIHSSKAAEVTGYNNELYKIHIQVALQFIQEDKRTVLSYANEIEMSGGGVHTTAFLSQIVNTIRFYAEKATDTRLEKDETLAGLTAAVHVHHPYPQFENIDGTRLYNPDVETPVSQVTEEAMQIFAEQHPDQMQAIVDHIIARKNAGNQPD